MRSIIHEGGLKMNKYLKVLLIEKGVRNFDLAKHLNCDPAKVSRIVNGWLEPDEETKLRIAKYLGINECNIWK